MNAFFKILLVFVLFSTYANTSDDKEVFIRMLREQNLELELKSYKGWVRILNNPHRRKIYGFDSYSPEEIQDAIFELREMQNSHLRGDL